MPLDPPVQLQLEQRALHLSRGCMALADQFVNQEPRLALPSQTSQRVAGWVTMRALHLRFLFVVANITFSVGAAASMYVVQLPRTVGSKYDRLKFADEVVLTPQRRWPMWYRLGLWLTAVVLAAAPALFGRPSSALAFAFALCAICIIDALEVILSTADDDWRKKIVMFVFPLVFLESLAIMYWSGTPLQPLNAYFWTVSAGTVTVGLVAFAFSVALVTRLLHAVR